MSIIVETTARAPSTFLRTAIIAVAGVAGLLLGGCAIRPTQEDVTHVSTKDIVTQIRCEARLAVFDKAIDLLGKQNDPTGRIARIIEDLAKERGAPLTFDPRRLAFAPSLSGFYQRYIDTAIAYDFTFEIQEDNNIVGNADPIRLITGGSVGVGLDARKELARSNIRRFLISETFRELLFNPRLVCPASIRVPNFIYPISGSVGLAEVIHTFIDLNESEQLDADSNARRFGDTLQFTTKFSASATPHVILAPVGRRWGLAPPAAGVQFEAARTDKHKLIIGLSMDPKKMNAPPITRPGFLGPVIQPPKVSRGPASNERRALEIIEDQRFKDFLDRGTIAVPR